MSKDAESRLLHETHDRKPEFAKMKPPVSAWITGLATIVALIACLGYSILFQKALSGFSKQVNAFVSIGDFSSNFLQAIVFIITAAVILYLLFIYLASVYFLFIGGIYSFCALVDQQCFDFKVLIPAIVSRFSNKKVDMTFCAEKKELLCSQQNNQIWNFFGAFICCIATFAAVLFIQNCVVYGLGKRQAAKEHKKREHYEMKSMSS
ncbi:unnamed protein product [Haemonchus placei]|uniref:MARVEL domain-containing protein n=1 Tax=Haemonchus placei TaxID=6290 RepID=A0A0N4WKH2_HAEPC|nr:unnamed protein product [Haemonchus placei]